MQHNVLFRLNAGKKYGWGHFSRSHALASILLNDANIFFYLNAESKTLTENRIDKAINTYFIHTENEFFEQIKKNDIVVLDGYDFNEIYRKKVKTKCKKLICIDDFPNGLYTCDAIINSADYAKNQHYQAQTYTKFFFGYEYTLLNKIFFEPITNTKREGIVISMGSLDPFEITTTILNTLLNLNFTLPIYVIYTDYFTTNQKRFIAKLANENKINAYKNLSAISIKNIMDKSKWGIFPASNVLLEALKRHVICAFGYFVDNQFPNYQSLIKYNVGLPLGNLTEVLWNNVLINFFKTKTDFIPSFANVIGSEVNKLKSFILNGN
ncbi:MAG: hypothetical protein ACUVQP_02590 [Bacteroidales bacterium]